MEKMNTGDSAEVFARYLHDTWGVGDKERDTGILLLLAVENRQIFISTGKGAREAVPDAAVQTIIDNMMVHLRNQKYGTAVAGAVKDVHLHLTEGLPESASVNFAPVFAACAAVLAFRLWLADSGTKKRRRDSEAEYAEVKEKLVAIEKEVKAKKLAEKFAALRCPICLKNFKSEKNRDEPKDDEPEILDCGHEFCVPCITEWLKTNKTCPICISDVPEKTDREAHFRLSSLRGQHPDFISKEAVVSWSNFSYQTNYWSFPLLRRRRDLSYTTASRSSIFSGFGSLLFFLLLVVWGG